MVIQATWRSIIDNFLVQPSVEGEGERGRWIWRRYLFLKNLHFFGVVKSRMSELTVSDDQESFPKSFFCVSLVAQQLRMEAYIF